MQTAQVVDITPAHFRRSMRRPTEATATQAGIFSDLADGTLAAQFFFNLADFEWKETKLFSLIVGLCGDGGQVVEMYDEELATHARCTDRTIRNWRRDYIGRAETISFSPLTIDEGEYDPRAQRYARTRYAVAPAVAEQIERAVTIARGMPDYAKDRVKALERAASECYDDIPDAPAKRRSRKPKKSHRSPVVQSINNAKKNLGAGKRALSEMPERMRAALLAGQGEDLRETLLAMQGEIAEILSSISQTVDETQVTDIPENFSGTPPDESRFRLKEKNTRKRPPEPEPEHSPEDVAMFDRYCKRAGGVPQTKSAEIELRAPDDGLLTEATSDERAVHARVAELIQGKAISAEQGYDFKSKAHDPEFRREFFKSYGRCDE